MPATIPSAVRPIALLLLATACNDISLSAIENKPPDAEIVSHRDGDSVGEGYVINLAGTVSDERGFEQVSARWFADDVEICADETVPEDGSTTCAFLVPAADTVRIRLEGRDGDQATENDLVDLIITPTVPPTVEITAPVSGINYYDNTDTRFAALVDDAEDDPTELTGVWTSDVDGDLTALAVSPDGSGLTEGRTTLSTGQHLVTLTVTDLTGKTASDSVTVTVVGPNTPPTCAFTAPGDGDYSGSFNEVVFAATSDDPDIAADTMTVDFSSDIDGVMGSTLPTINGDIQFPYDQLSIATHIITMVVTDDAGATCTDTLTHIVVDPPSAPVVHVEPQNPASADDLVCVIDVPSVDPQGDPLTYFATWTRDGVDFAGSSTTDETGDTVEAYNTNPGQLWRCEMFATDGFTTSSPGFDEVTVETPMAEFVLAGVDHSCLLDSNQRLECWGESSFNKLALTGGFYLDASAGNNHTCGIDLNGLVQCDGLAGDGQTNTSGLIGTFTDIDGGDAFNCAVDNTQGVQCWGDNTDGQVSQAASLTGAYVQVSVSFRHACAVTTTDGIDCWGSDVFNRGTPPPGVAFAQVTAGKYHTCGLDQGGGAHCWGKNDFGESTPPGGTFAMLAAGEGITCGLRGNGVVECWGQLTGPGELNEAPVGNFVHVELSDGAHQCAAEVAGGVVCWGEESGFGETLPPLIWW